MKAEQPRAVYSCERPSDCGKGYGCFSGTGFPYFETYSCREVETSCTRVVDSPYLCDKLADCPPRVVGDTSTAQLTTEKPISCTHDASDPPSVKRCVY
jgi:hypothetical protein